MTEALKIAAEWDKTTFGDDTNLYVENEIDSAGDLYVSLTTSHGASGERKSTEGYFRRPEIEALHAHLGALLGFVQATFPEPTPPTFAVGDLVLVEPTFRNEMGESDCSGFGITAAEVVVAARRDGGSCEILALDGARAGWRCSVFPAHLEPYDVTPTPDFAVGDVLLIDPDAKMDDGRGAYFHPSVSAVEVVRVPGNPSCPNDYSVRALDGDFEGYRRDCGDRDLGIGQVQWVGAAYLEAYPEEQGRPCADCPLKADPFAGWEPLGFFIDETAAFQAPALPPVEDLPLGYAMQVVALLASAAQG